MGQKPKGVKLTAFARDVESASEGKWFDIQDDFRIKLASTNNSDYITFVRRKTKGYGRQLKRGRLDARAEAQIRPILKEACARHLVKDWQNLQDNDGNDVPFSTDEAVSILTNPVFEPLYDFIMDIVDDEASFAAEDLEDDEGNSSSISSGGSATAQD